MIAAIRISMLYVKPSTLLGSKLSALPLQKNLWNPTVFSSTLSSRSFSQNSKEKGVVEFFSSLVRGKKPEISYYTPAKPKAADTLIIGYENNAKELKEKNRMIYKIVDAISAPEAFVNGPQLKVLNIHICPTEDPALISHVVNMFRQEGFQVEYGGGAFLISLPVHDVKDAAGNLSISVVAAKKTLRETTERIHQFIYRSIDQTVKKHPGNSSFEFRIPFEYANSVVIDWMIDTLKANEYSAGVQKGVRPDSLGRDVSFLVCKSEILRDPWHVREDLPELSLPELHAILKPR